MFQNILVNWEKNCPYNDRSSKKRWSVGNYVLHILWIPANSVSHLHIRVIDGSLNRGKSWTKNMCHHFKLDKTNKETKNGTRTITHSHTWFFFPPIWSYFFFLFPHFLIFPLLWEWQGLEKFIENKIVKEEWLSSRNIILRRESSDANAHFIRNIKILIFQEAFTAEKNIYLTVSITS